MGFLCHKNEYYTFPNNVIGIKDKNNNIAYIDAEDLDKVYKYTFCKDNGGYFRTGNKNNKYIPLHDVVLNKTDKTLVVDHINRCKLDNRKCNLRVVPQSTNCTNQKLRSTNSTGFNGVSYDKKRNRYCAYYSKKSLGKFKTLEEAIKAREEYEEWAGIT